MPSLLRVADLSRQDVNELLERAAQLRSARCLRPENEVVLTLAFMTPSLRTRMGFAAAAARLGWRSVFVDGFHSGTGGGSESWPDTLRVIAGLSDVVVTRADRPLCAEDADSIHPVPLINAGDVGPLAEHPTQALVDIFAIQHLVGPVADLRIGLVGDPRTRVARSLIACLSILLPRALILVANLDHLDSLSLSSELRERTHLADWRELEHADAVYLSGLPHGSTPQSKRGKLIMTDARLAALQPNALLLSPMPVIDEMSAGVRDSPRNLMFEQNRLGVYVRMALLEFAVGQRPSVKAAR